MQAGSGGSHTICSGSPCEEPVHAVVIAGQQPCSIASPEVLRKLRLESVPLFKHGEASCCVAPGEGRLLEAQPFGYSGVDPIAADQDLQKPCKPMVRKLISLSDCSFSGDAHKRSSVPWL